MLLSLKPFVGQKKVRKGAIVLQNTLLRLTIFRLLQKIYVICYKNVLYKSHNYFGVSHYSL